jgi:hypothetical protein
MKWSIQELREDVELVNGEAQRNLLSPCLESIVDRKLYARYHFQEFERLLKEFLADRSKISLLKLVFDNDEDERSNFYLCRKQAEANIMGCLQSMHTIADILSHVIYYSLNMNRYALLKMVARKVSILSVQKKLTGISEYETLRNLINQLIGHADYKYLCDIVNHSKHRSIVGTSFTVNFGDDVDRLHGLEFLAFEYESRLHPERWVDEYLKNEYKRQDSLIIEIGNEINRVVRARVTNSP